MTVRETERERENEKGCIGHEMSQRTVMNEATEEAEVHQCQAGTLGL